MNTSKAIDLIKHAINNNATPINSMERDTALALQAALHALQGDYAEIEYLAKRENKNV